MHDDYAIEQATAAPGEKRDVPTEQRCSNAAMLAFGDGARRVWCRLPLGHAGDHEYRV